MCVCVCDGGEVRECVCVCVYEECVDAVEKLCILW